jgi:hypothetical protein
MQSIRHGMRFADEELENDRRTAWPGQVIHFHLLSLNRNLTSVGWFSKESFELLREQTESHRAHLALFRIA